MKTLINFCMAMLFTSTVWAQGNLQFSQVINYTMSTPYAAGSSRPTETLTVTVPAGKTIKIESVHISYQGSSSNTYGVGNNSNPSGHVVLNGGVIAAFDNGLPLNPGPIWLAAGTHTIILQGYLNSSSSYRWNAFITGIEFDIIP